MNIEVSGQWLKITLSGEIDLAWKVAHQAKLEDICRQPWVTVVLDLKRVSFMDSTGLSFVAQLVRSCKPQGGTVYLLWPTEQLGSAIHTVGLDRLAEVVVIGDEAAYAQHAEVLAAPGTDADPDLLPA